METRAAQLRARDRKVLAWSLIAAVVVHLVAFVLVPAFRTKPIATWGLRPQATRESNEGVTRVEVLFGPPTISAPDGTTWTEPADRILQAERGVQLSEACTALAHKVGVPAHGRVRLRVDQSGLAKVMYMTRGTGDACADSVVTMMAGDLWYHWLPSDRFPAPVELTQPVTLADVGS